MSLIFNVRQRRSDREFADVKTVGQASSELGALEILKGYASRCRAVSWIEYNQFNGFENGENGETLFVEAWVEAKEGEKDG